ncbi:amino acid kinase family protein [Sphaerotilus natans]|jgi:aspartokinase-like uncharacterized kinase|uniref:amino acid kinase family protein n=1 Tax=Sphaerotilus natans TaxID=34103 RepID=UPI00406D225B
MWVIKLGGSLLGDACLTDWLTLVAQIGGGRVTLVCGGGTLADEVRRLQARWQVDDLTAHNMAVLTMVQNAHLLQALAPTLQPVAREADIMPVLRRGGVALWMPLDLLRARPDADTCWDVTSDSIALALAQRLHAERLVVVKSCEIDERLTLDQLGELDILDRRFATLAATGCVPIEVLCRSQVEVLRGGLLGACEGGNRRYG